MTTKEKPVALATRSRSRPRAHIVKSATPAIADDSVIRLSLADQETLAAALLDDKPHPPPRKLARLARAVQEHSQSVESL